MPRRLDRSAACHSWSVYFRYVADQWWLKDWQISVSGEQPNSCDCYAEVECTVELRLIEVALSDKFLDHDDERVQRRVAAHEVLHGHFEACAQMAERHMGTHYADFLMMFEQGIDGVATAFAEKLLLPSQVLPVAAEEEVNDEHAE